MTKNSFNSPTPKQNYQSISLKMFKSSRAFCISQQNVSVPLVYSVCLSLYLINTRKTN